MSNRYATTSNVSLMAGLSATTPDSLRAFGWFGERVAVSQRVANETAQVLQEIEERFPVP